MRFEVEWRGQHDEAFRPGEAVECDIALLPHNAAAAIGTNQISARMRIDAIGTANVDADGVGGLTHVDDFMTEKHLDVRQLAHAVENELGGFELFALDDEGMLRVVLEDGMVEFGDLLAARPVPELEDRRHQTDTRHVVGEAIVGQQIERRGMGGRRARVGLRAFIDVKQPNGNALATEQPRTEQPDRAAACDQHALIVTRHIKSLLYSHARRASAL